MSKKVVRTNKKSMEKMAYALSDFEVDCLVKIAGTEHDARRVLTDEDIRLIRLLHDDGVNVNRLSRSFNVSYYTIKRVVDDDFRKKVNESRKGYKVNPAPISTKKRRIDVKRNLIAKNKVVFIGAV